MQMLAKFARIMQIQSSTAPLPTNDAPKTAAKPEVVAGFEDLLAQQAVVVAEGTTSPEAVAVEPAPGLEIAPEPETSDPKDDPQVVPATANPVPTAPVWAMAMAIAPVMNPSVQPLAAPTNPKPATTEIAPVAETTSSEESESPVLSLPKAPEGIRLDVAVVEVPPKEEPGVAAVEIDGDDDTSELELPDLPAPESDGTPGSNTARVSGAESAPSHRVVAGAKVETPAGAEFRVDTHNLVRELADRLEMMVAARQKEGVLVQMEPPDLGQVTLLVKPDAAGRVSAEITATHDLVRHALENSQSEIQHRLELRGLVVAQVSVTAETSNFNPREGSHRPRTPQPTPASTNGDSDSKFGTSGVVSVPTVRRARRQSGLDLWI